MQESKYKSKKYRENVRTWIARLRHADGRAEHEQSRRQAVLGTLATGGKGGHAPKVSL